MDTSEVQIFIKDLTESKLSVEVRSFCAKANGILKTFEGFEYNPEKKIWTYPIEQKNKIIEELNKDFDVIIM